MSLALLVHAAACVAAGDGQQRGAVVRVSSSAGLSEFIPGPSLSGDTAAALDLVYEFTKDYSSIERLDRLRVAFVLSSPEVMPGERFAETFTCRGATVETISPSRVVVAFADPRGADFAEFGYCGLSIGPYAVDEAGPDRVSLRLRSGEGFERIEIVRTLRSEEWRRLMARQIDVVPRMDGAVLGELSSLSSVRIVSISEMSGFALLFNTHTAPWNDAHARRTLVSAIDVVAVGRLACGGLDCGIVAPGIASSNHQLPLRATLIVLDGESTHQAVAQVLRHQMRAVGVEIEIQRVSIQRYVERTTSGDYELALGPISLRDSVRARQWLSPGHPGSINITGYSNPDLDAAFERGDFGEIDEIVNHDVPAFPLYRPRDVAAIEATICGDVEPTMTSWRWIADLHPCEP